MTSNAPKTRGDCIDGPRPCPWTRCRYHLAPDFVLHGIGEAESAWLLRMGEAFGMKETCALDVADAGAHDPDEIGKLLGLTRKNVLQLEIGALVKIHQHKGVS